MRNFIFILFMVGVSWITNAKNFYLRGQIIDKENQQPIPEISIQIRGKEDFFTRTNNQGEFLVENIAAGFYKISLTHISYNSKEINFLLTSDTTLIFTLEKNSFLIGDITVIENKYQEKRTVESNYLGYINKRNIGQDIPFILNNSPSVVSTSDAGTGIGYTSIRIRGSDASRINVTVNGIPLNDAESQEVFWVNLPDFASSTNSIQVQRGVGNSTNGAGSFGATINLQTDEWRKKSYVELNNSYGSFRTWKTTLKTGTGLLNDHWIVDARLSKIQSDGYIDRASSSLKSFFVSGGYRGKKSSIKLNIFSGNEITYQAWNGVPENLLETQRTYNEYTYPNQTDNYQQDHYQLFYTQSISEVLKLNLAFHYTRGKGYFEEYKIKDKLEDYNLPPVIIGDTTIYKTDLIRRRWLDNNFYGSIFSFFYKKNKIDAVLGGGINEYDGKHFGEIIWAEFPGKNSIDTRYYNDFSKKIDFNSYLKIKYQFNYLFSSYVDLQVRTVDYSFLGFDNELNNVPQHNFLFFFNPKIGLEYQMGYIGDLFASFSTSHREPNRKDYIESSINSRPKPETLQDLEIGLANHFPHFSYQINYYLMNYLDQLVLTGQVNDVGQYTRMNVNKSYRTGIEINFTWKINSKFTLEGNGTYSINRIKNFQEYINDYDTGLQKINSYQKTDIAFSPRVISSGILTYNPIKNIEASFITKYVSKQYLDNTSDETKKLNSFLVNNVQVWYRFSLKYIKEIRCGILINNLFNKLYEPNGYTYSYITGGEIIKNNFYYPQAGRNFIVSLGITLE